MIADASASERNFLGCLLLSPHAYYATAETVTPDMFSDQNLAAIYSAMQKAAEAGQSVGIPVLRTKLPAELPGAGPTEPMLWVLRENARDAGSADDYAGAIAEVAAQRRLQALGDWIKAETGKGARGIEELAAEAAVRLQDIMAVSAPVRPKQIGEVAHHVLRQANDAYSGQAVPGLTTGLVPLDEIAGMMLGGDLVVLIASQADGKSALAAQIGMHAARGGRPVLMFSFEMSADQLAAREVSALSEIPVSQIHEGTFDAFQWQDIAASEQTLRSVPFHIVDSEQMTVRQMRAQALAMKRNAGLSLVIIDQLDKIKADGKHRDRFERMAEVTGDVKRMAKGLGVPVILLAQRTRGAQRKDDPTPDILDADAPSLERDADLIIGLWRRVNWLRRHRPERGGEEELTKWQADMARCADRADVICLKRRRGKAFEQRALTFRGQTMRFEVPET
ncbi:DnaB-like helicase C-terminal domain-containing protein [Rhodopseudomonas sp. B29]|uniref:replicative DNA helicase n=1 Tax=Rhodopseudomonas sp. B29 TaxID=95607 RepID=UPI0003459EF3|nr:DnaB-like helicase C-terminal domain-containing protein [Rhodopseudomonas sp. B29]